MDMTRSRVIIAVLAVAVPILFTSCKKPGDSQGKKQAGATTASDDAGPRKDDGGAAKSTPEGKKQQALIPQKQVQELVDRWLAAQNQGDFAAYSALYGENFGGVRRSGKKAVRLDRAGWLKDRGRMFKNKMTVTISDVDIAVGAKSARVHFIQEWASGKYHDVGPKVIVIAKTDKGLVIVREEMLSSMLMGSGDELPLASDLFALVYESISSHTGQRIGAPMVVLDKTADPAWATGTPTLLAGELVEQDRDCEYNSPDYETEQQRYWECVNSDPDNAYDHFVASQAVKAADLPAELKAWTGKKLALYGAAGRVCQATTRDMLLWAEQKTTMTGLGAAGSEDHQVAAATLDSEAVLMTPLESDSDSDSDCAGAVFARSAALPAPRQWTLAAPEAALAAAVERALAGVYGHDELVEGASAVGWGTPKITMQAVNPPGEQRRFVVASVSGPLSCHEDGFVISVWEVKGSQGRPTLEQVFEEGDRPIEVRAAVDITGTGVPVLVLDDGVLVWRGDSFAHVQVVSFPEKIMDACHCECE